MRMHRVTLMALATVIVTAGGLVACSDGETTAPRPRALGSEGPSAAAPTDTVKPPPTSFRVFGQILGVSVRAPGGGSADTLRFEPIVGANVAIYRNVVVNGDTRQVLAAQTTSGANGAYQVSGLPGGFYIVKAAAPARSPYADGWSYLSGTSPDVKVDVYLWRTP